MELKKVILALGPEWQDQADRLSARLARQSGELQVCGAEEEWPGGFEAPCPGTDGGVCDSVVVTDDRSLAVRCAAQGFVCVGCASAEEDFFDGAALVTDNPDGLDAAELEECLLHAQGRPVTIARTARLVLREIAEGDFARLLEISRQEGMRYALGSLGENCFEPERLSAYIRHVYRFYGYGLWSVLLTDGTLIGCCGFGEFASGEEPADRGTDGENSGGVQIELQYMVAREFQRQGFGEEMCRAALDCAVRRTGRDTVWLRVHPENRTSLGLAKKLGFAYNRTGKDGLLLFSRRVS